MAININTNVEGEWFTPSSQENESEPARLFIKPLPGHLMRKIIGDELRGGGALTDENMSLAIRHGVTDWENVSIDGNAKFNVNKVLVHFDADDQIEIASEIISSSKMDKESEKN